MKHNKKIPIIFLAFLISTTLNSCMVTKTTVGTFEEIEGKEYRYSKGKQIWLFWGIIPLGRTNVNTPNDGNCEIITKYTFGDLLVKGLTGGLVKTYTIKVKAKKKE